MQPQQHRRQPRGRHNNGQQQSQQHYGNNSGGGFRRASSHNNGVPNRNQSYDSNGPDVRIRGTAQQVYEKYTALARDAAASGDSVSEESLLQHAEHYYRIVLSIQEHFEQNRPAQQPMMNQQPQHNTQNGAPNNHAMGNGAYVPSASPAPADHHADHSGGAAEELPRFLYQAGNAQRNNSGIDPNGPQPEAAVIYPAAAVAAQQAQKAQDENDRNA